MQHLVIAAHQRTSTAQRFRPHIHSLGEQQHHHHHQDGSDSSQLSSIPIRIPRKTSHVKSCVFTSRLCCVASATHSPRKTRPPHLGKHGSTPTPAITSSASPTNAAAPAATLIKTATLPLAKELLYTTPNGISIMNLATKSLVTNNNATGNVRVIVTGSKTQNVGPA